MRRYPLVCAAFVLVLPACSGVANMQKSAQAERHVERGQGYAEKKEYDKAILEFTEAIRLDPKNAEAYHERGRAYVNIKEYDKAISDFTEAIRIEPDAGSYVARGGAYEHKKDYATAVSDYEKALELDAEDDDALDSLAWVLASCPKDGVRNGPRAVELATKACKGTDWQNADFLDTLAAAHAEARNFNEAVRWQKKALEVGFAEKKDKKDAEARLRLYQAGKPYRDE
jgi:tetratricopeptide (TPR) repeat protein